MASEDNFRGAIVQLCSGENYKDNLKKVDGFIKEARKKGVSNIFLPEAFYALSDGISPTAHLIQKGNQHEQNLLNLAKENKVYLLGGSCATKIGEKIFNRSYCISPEGEIISSYDKINLFRCCFKSEKQQKEIKIDEGIIYSPGGGLGCFNYSESWRMGMSICFDIRFSEHYLALRKMGANILMIPSAFTKKSGKMHWHTLNKARAIEFQSFVISAAQVGQNNERVSTYGHSLVVSPMGEIICDLGGEKEGVEIFTLDLSDIIKARSQIMMGR